MATTIHLIRHAPHADVGQRLSGRLAGRVLTEAGRTRADRLAARFRDVPIASVQSSPMERAVETARPLGAMAGCGVTPIDALNEIDFGEWSGATFAALEDDPRWRRWNERRADGRCPGGESMADAQRRVADHLFGAGRDHDGEALVMVTHCDIIRAAVAQVIGLSLDHVHRFEVSPASVTTVLVEGDHARLVNLNERVS